MITKISELVSKKLKLSGFQIGNELFYFNKLHLLFIFPVFLFRFFLPGLSSDVQQEPAFQFYTEDSILVDVFSLFDAENTLDNYTARIFTPICEDSVCYSVELDFYWDVLGNFQKYELLPGKPLTKREHDPFTNEDYEKLASILTNKQPAFVSMQKEDLIAEVVRDTLDGITGATVAAVKDEIVPGAAYSCYTLWHIAHGSVVSSIQKYTKERLDLNLVEKLIATNDETVHSFLIDSFDEEDFQTYLPQVLHLIEHNGVYFAKETIEKIPGDLLADKEVQAFFSRQYDDLGYFAQLSLLRQMEHKPLTNDLAEVLINNLDGRGSAQNERILQSVLRTENLEVETIKGLLSKIIRAKIPLSTEAYEKVIGLAQKKELLKKDIQAFKRGYKKIKK